MFAPSSEYPQHYGWMVGDIRRSGSVQRKRWTKFVGERISVCHGCDRRSARMLNRMKHKSVDGPALAMTLERGDAMKSLEKLHEATRVQLKQMARTLCVRDGAHLSQEDLKKVQVSQSISHFIVVSYCSHRIASETPRDHHGQSTISSWTASSSRRFLPTLPKLRHACSHRVLRVDIQPPGTGGGSHQEK